MKFLINEEQLDDIIKKYIKKWLDSFPENTESIDYIDINSNELGNIDFAFQNDDTSKIFEFVVHLKYVPNNFTKMRKTVSNKLYNLFDTLYGGNDNYYYSIKFLLPNDRVVKPSEYT